MILVVDSSALVLLINTTGNPPDDPNTKAPTTDVPQRIAHFLGTLTAADTIIIPTPVLAEALVQAEEGGPGILAALGGQARMKVRPFGERAAVETAAMTREAIQAGDKKGGSSAPWQKVKVDRQIIAIARVEGATHIYADDTNLVGFAKILGMDAFSTWELPTPEPVVDLFTAAGLTMTPDASATEYLDNDDELVETILRDLEQQEQVHAPETAAPEQTIVATDDPDEDVVDQPVPPTS